jgi:hypothetical protein
LCLFLTAGLHAGGLESAGTDLTHVPDAFLVARTGDTGGGLEMMVGVEFIDEDILQVSGVVHATDMDEAVFVPDPVAVPALEGGAVMERLLAQGLPLPVRLGATNSPSSVVTASIRIPTCSTEAITRRTEKPAARMATSSLLEASMPRPMRLPSRAAMGNSSWTGAEW